jgi:hypothetical protein
VLSEIRAIVLFQVQHHFAANQGVFLLLGMLAPARIVSDHFNLALLVNRLVATYCNFSNSLYRLFVLGFKESGLSHDIMLVFAAPNTII